MDSVLLVIAQKYNVRIILVWHILALLSLISIIQTPWGKAPHVIIIDLYIYIYYYFFNNNMYCMFPDFLQGPSRSHLWSIRTCLLISNYAGKLVHWERSDIRIEQPCMKSSGKCWGWMSFIFTTMFHNQEWMPFVPVWGHKSHTSANLYTLYSVVINHGYYSCDASFSLVYMIVFFPCRNLWWTKRKH